LVVIYSHQKQKSTIKRKKDEKMIGLFVFTIAAAACITLGLLVVGIILNLLTPLLGLFGVLWGTLKFAYEEKRPEKVPVLLHRPVRIDIRH
jgi:hypothetical protein